MCTDSYLQVLAVMDQSIYRITGLFRGQLIFANFANGRQFAKKLQTLDTPNNDYEYWLVMPWRQAWLSTALGFDSSFNTSAISNSCEQQHARYFHFSLGKVWWVASSSCNSSGKHSSSPKKTTRNSRNLLSKQKYLVIFASAYFGEWIKFIRENKQTRK